MTPRTAAYQAPPSMGFSRQEYWSGVPLPSPRMGLDPHKSTNTPHQERKREQKKVVWRCINRLDYGRKYCHKSPSIEEGLIHKAIMKAVQSVAQQDVEVLKTLKVHMATVLAGETTEDESIQLRVRIAEIDTEIKTMINAVSADNVNGFDDNKAQALIKEKSELQERLAQAVNKTKRREIAESRLDEIYLIMDGLKNRPLIYDNELIRKILECVVVISKEKIKVVFKGGLEIEQELEDEKVA